MGCDVDDVRSRSFSPLAEQSVRIVEVVAVAPFVASFCKLFSVPAWLTMDGLTFIVSSPSRQLSTRPKFLCCNVILQEIKTLISPDGRNQMLI